MMTFLSILQWCWGHKRTVAEAALALALVFVSWRYNHDKAALAKQAAEAQGLAANLSQQLTIKNGQLEILRRGADGNVTYRNVYVPPEGSVVISEKEHTAIQHQIDDLTRRLAAALEAGNTNLVNEIRHQIGTIPEIGVNVKSSGLTFRPGYGLSWANAGIKPHLDAKLYYWNRYGVIIGGGENGLGAGASRHLDDVLYGHPQNVEIFAMYNAVRFHPNGQQVTIGLRSNF